MDELSGAVHRPVEVPWALSCGLGRGEMEPTEDGLAQGRVSEQAFVGRRYRGRNGERRAPPCFDVKPNGRLAEEARELGFGRGAKARPVLPLDQRSGWWRTTTNV